MFPIGLDILDFFETPWLTGWEQIRVLEALLRFRLIKYSNAHDLPLKKGGDTDIYINLREARNSPDAIKFVA